MIKPKGLMVALVVVACSNTAVPSSPPVTVETSTTTLAAAATTLSRANLLESTTIDGGLPVDIYGPDDIGDWPVAVLFHGGGWFGGEPLTMAPLADDLAERGFLVFNATYRTANGGYPESFEDVACAVRYAVERAPHFTTDLSPPTIVGHSAGAQLASVIALSGDTFTGDCPVDGSALPSRFVGLAGPYDVSRFALVLASFFGTRYEVDPSPWEDGSPFFHLGDNPDLAVLLVHGDADELVPFEFSDQLREAMEESGYQVVLEVLEGATHAEARHPDRVGGLIEEFVNG